MPNDGRSRSSTFSWRRPTLLFAKLISDRSRDNGKSRQKWYYHGRNFWQSRQNHGV